MTPSVQIKVNHIAVHVADLNRSKDFYQHVMGLKEIEEPFKDGFHAWYEIGEWATLHLIEGPGMPLEKSKINHLCFCVSDLEEFIRLLKSIRHPFGNWEGDLEAIHLRGDGIRQIFFQDPDGYWLEINDDF